METEEWTPSLPNDDSSIPIATPLEPRVTSSDTADLASTTLSSSSAPNFTCDQCGKAFSKRQHLRLHVTRAHGKQKDGIKRTKSAKKRKTRKKDGDGAGAATAAAISASQFVTNAIDAATPVSNDEVAEDDVVEENATTSKSLDVISSNGNETLPIKSANFSFVNETPASACAPTASASAVAAPAASETASASASASACAPTATASAVESDDDDSAKLPPFLRHIVGGGRAKDVGVGNLMSPLFEQSETTDSVIDHKCPTCGEGFDSKMELDKHLGEEMVR